MKINPMCDLLVGNRPENDSDTQYYECEDCHRYETCKKYGCIEACSLEEIKEATPNILEPSYDLLKQEGYFEMSMISELIKNLRWYGSYADSAEKDLMYEAADTIEALSAKLAAANMERSDRYYGGGWISCEDRLPEEEKEVLVCFYSKTCNKVGFSKKNIKVAKLTSERRDEYGNKEIGFIGSAVNHSIKEVLAWQPLPEPYRP